MEEDTETQYDDDEDDDDDDDSMNLSDDYLSTYADTSYADAAAYYGYEDRVPTSEIMDSFPEGPGSPLPADRLARKQRLRRGGHCHSSLLHSAVMACMASPRDDEGKPSMDSSLLLTSSSETSSPRKRIRRTDRPRAQIDEQVIAGASVMLASLSMAPLDSASNSGPSHHERMSEDFNRAPPVRRVSRRKSYTSVASGASDYDDEEFFNLDD